MVNFSDAFFFGLSIGNISRSIHNVDSVFHGALWASLVYENKKEGIAKKREFYLHVKKEVNELNKEIKDFNNIKESIFSHTNLEDIGEVDISEIKKIIDKHKGDYHVDYPKKTDKRNGAFSDIKGFVLGTEDSPSSLSRRNTFILLERTLDDTKKSVHKLMENIRNNDDFSKLFWGDKKNRYRKYIKSEIKKASDCYSFCLIGEAVFIIGRCVEKVLTDYLICLKKQGKIKYKLSEIKSWDYDTKINILGKKEKIITQNQYSKLMSLKWDRNIFGHHSKQKEIIQSTKDAEAIIRIGINLLNHFEQKINK